MNTSLFYTFFRVFSERGPRISTLNIIWTQIEEQKSEVA